MTTRGAWFSWRVTRLLFSCAVALLTMGLIRLMISASWFSFAFVIAGLALGALATRGPWDSEESGRNRSVLGFRARSQRGD